MLRCGLVDTNAYNPDDKKQVPLFNASFAAMVEEAAYRVIFLNGYIKSAAGDCMRPYPLMRWFHAYISKRSLGSGVPVIQLPSLPISGSHPLICQSGSSGDYAEAQKVRLLRHQRPSGEGSVSFVLQVVVRGGWKGDC